MAENFPNLMKNINLHIQEAQVTQNRINSKRFTAMQWKYWKPKAKRISWKQEEKNIHHVKENPSKINIWLLIRNNGNQEAVG